MNPFRPCTGPLFPSDNSGIPDRFAPRLSDCPAARGKHPERCRNHTGPHTVSLRAPFQHPLLPLQGIRPKVVHFHTSCVKSFFTGYSPALGPVPPCLGPGGRPEGTRPLLAPALRGGRPPRSPDRATVVPVQYWPGASNWLCMP